MTERSQNFAKYGFFSEPVRCAPEDSLRQEEMHPNENSIRRKHFGLKKHHFIKRNFSLNLDDFQKKKKKRSKRKKSIGNKLDFNEEEVDGCDSNHKEEMF